MSGIISTALIAIGTGSAAGLRPYFTVFFLGMAKLLIPADAVGPIGSVLAQIPELLMDPWVLGITGLLAAGEFIVDKFQFLDQIWDTIQSILRPIFGALVGLQIGDEHGAAAMATGAILGGGAATGVSLGKSALRGVINLLPEPISNFLTSLGEDLAAVVLLIGVIILPPLAAVAGLIMLAIGIWLFLRLRRVLQAARRYLAGAQPAGAAPPAGQPAGAAPQAGQPGGGAPRGGRMRSARGRRPADGSAPFSTLRDALRADPEVIEGEVIEADSRIVAADQPRDQDTPPTR